MKDIVIVGAGGFGREVQWLIGCINEEARKGCEEDRWNLSGYIDDALTVGTEIDGVDVIGGVDYLISYGGQMAVACAIGNVGMRDFVASKIRGNKNLTFPNLVDPSVQLSPRVDMGQGNIICAGSIFTVDICISDFCIITLNCTVGHDVSILEFVTLYPDVNISGCVKLGACSEIGTGSQIIQGKTIGCGTVIGAGSTVLEDIPDGCTAVGCPCKPIKHHKNLQRRFGGVAGITPILPFTVMQRKRAA